MSNTYLYSALAVMALVTAALRFLPFLLFGGGRKTPKTVEKLSRTLPSAVMAMLVVYCLKGVQWTAVPHGIPEVVSVAVVAALHKWKGNVLLSIAGGTVGYMFLLQVVFA